MNTIWKFSIPLVDTFTLALPSQARFLDVQVQRGIPQMWFLLDPEEEKVPRDFVVVGTGGFVQSPDALTHLGTFQLYEGDLFIHLFESRRSR